MIKLEKTENIIKFDDETIKECITQKIQILSRKIINYNQTLINVMLSKKLINENNTQNNQDENIGMLLVKSSLTLLQLKSCIYQEKEKSILELNEMIKQIITNENLRRIFEVKRYIDESKIDILLDDIQNCLSSIDFENNEEISKFIFAYIKKFIK